MPLKCCRISRPSVHNENCWKSSRLLSVFENVFKKFFLCWRLIFFVSRRNRDTLAFSILHLQTSWTPKSLVPRLHFFLSWNDDLSFGCWKWKSPHGDHYFPLLLLVVVEKHIYTLCSLFFCSLAPREMGEHRLLRRLATENHRRRRRHAVETQTSRNADGVQPQSPTWKGVSGSRKLVWVERPPTWSHGQFGIL